MYSPEAVLDEVCVILGMIFPQVATEMVEHVFQRTLELFAGQYPGYRACNTKYHDIHHSTAAFLAAARLIHGAVLCGEVLSERRVTIALIAALLHDAGYIQKADDRQGTGAKYTANHVQRSVAFLETVGPSLGLSEEDIGQGRAMILCTELSGDIASVSFGNSQTEFLGRVLEVGDLLGQRADRAYPEKLLLLYREFKEGDVGDFKDEIDLLRDSISFSDFAKKHIKKTLEKSSEYIRAHFATRWNVSEDLYETATKKNMEYVKWILSTPGIDPLEHLRRSGVVKRLRAGV
jgi:hypothetical protein